MGFYEPDDYDYEIPEKYMTCWYCENYDGGWMVCKLACKRNGIVAETEKEFDNILYAMEEDSEEFKAIARKEDDYCDDYEPDINDIADAYDPYEDLTPSEYNYYRFED